MRSFPLGCFVAVVVCTSCSSKNTNGTPAGDVDAGAQTLSYMPQGCAYAVSPPDTRSFTDLALDDASAIGDANAAAPVRVRLGLGGGTTSKAAGYADPSTSAAFTWETIAQNHAAKVRFGSDPTALSEVRAGYVWTTPPPTLGLGGNEPATYMHEVHVCGLAAGKTYYYQVGGGPVGGDAWSATQSFTTVPASGPVTIGISGDARDKVTTFQLVQSRMRDAAVNVQLFSGDLVDIGGLESLFATWLDAAWKDPADATKFLTLGQQLFLPIAGNHENEAARFYANFSLPGDGAYAESYASFNAGGAHVVMMDDQPIASAQGSDQAAAQLAWLEADLGRADGDRAAHPFVIVVSHRGIFSTSLHSNDPDVLAARSSLAPIFDKHHVDLVMNGHDHEYERSKPLKAGSNAAGDPVVQTSAADGTTYVICAGAGADPYAAGTFDSPYRELSKPFGMGTDIIGAYALVTIDGPKLTLKAYGLKAAGGSVAGDTVLDTLELSH